jgi:hypothetical protein
VSRSATSAASAKEATLEKLVKDGEVGEDEGARAEKDLEAVDHEAPRRPGRRPAQAQGSRAPRGLSVEPGPGRRRRRTHPTSRRRPTPTDVRLTTPPRCSRGRRPPKKSRAGRDLPAASRGGRCGLAALVHRLTAHRRKRGPSSRSLVDRRDLPGGLGDCVERCSLPPRASTHPPRAAPPRGGRHAHGLRLRARGRGVGRHLRPDRSPASSSGARPTGLPGRLVT